MFHKEPAYSYEKPSYKFLVTPTRNLIHTSAMAIVLDFRNHRNWINLRLFAENYRKLIALETTVGIIFTPRESC